MKSTDTKLYDLKYLELLKQDPSQKKYVIWLRVEAWYFANKKKRKYQKYEYFRSAFSKRKARYI